MEPSFGDWQPGHLRLNAPESFVLLNGPSANAKEVFRLALHELIGRGLVRSATHQEGSGKTTRRSALLMVGAPPPANLSRSLRSVLDAWQDVPVRSDVIEGPSISLRDLAAALRKRHGGRLNTWVTDEVLPVLIERGLYVKEDYKRLWIFSATRYEPTAEGKAARALLEESIQRTRSEFPDWASNDPVRAAAFLATAGSAVLLMPEIRPAAARLREASSGDAAPMYASDTGSGPSERPNDDFDIDTLDDAGDDLETLDLDIDYGQIDSDSYGGDGGDGSDGGGGDGGSD